MNKSRKQYTDEFKKEAASLFLSGRMEIREISKRKKVAEGMVRRWAREFKDQLPAADPHAGTALVPINGQEPVQTLETFKKPRRGGRYTTQQKSIVVQVIASGKLPMAEIQRRTGIHLTTLYSWDKEVKRGEFGGSAQEGLHVERTISTAQAAIHLKRAKAELLSGIKRGAIEDFDNVHLNALLAFNALLGK